MNKEFELQKLVRPNIWSLKPYSSARSEYSGITPIAMNANESPFGFGFNRYPDAHMKALISAFSEYRKVDPKRVTFGNGSDEIIDLIIRIFCIPGKDKILICPPTFSMYKVFAETNDVGVVEVPLDSNFQLQEKEIVPLLSEEDLKIIFICSPNNPTGNQMDLDVIRNLTRKFKGVVVVDEAYVDFSEGSLIEENFPNLIVTQTFSKAFGLASLRLGACIASNEIIGIINKVRAPYNVNDFTQKKAIELLRKPQEISRKIEILLTEREKLREGLLGIPSVKKVHHSDANFLLVDMDDAAETYQLLLDKGIVVRKIAAFPTALRVTVGTPSENIALLAALKGIPVDNKGRVGEVIRKTSETSIRVKVNLDDPSGKSIYTGVGFFDHMLDQIARHGAIGLEVEVSGDLEIDTHHTIEDTALALGAAFDQALGDRKGMERYGFLLPMDDCLAQVALDFGGRPWLEWSVDFKATYLGEMPTEMAYHFFKSFSDKARCNLNIKAEGDNDHHKIESIFKGLARAIKMAVRKDESGVLPSTKGVL